MQTRVAILLVAVLLNGVKIEVTLKISRYHGSP